jgi:hypothetical protein
MDRIIWRIFVTSCIRIRFLTDSSKRWFFLFLSSAIAYSYRYARIVNRIFNNPSVAPQRTAKKLIGWISFAKRPLKWHEIQGATSIDVERSIVNFRGRQLPDDVRDICGSLVEILPGDRVQLVHPTARRYVYPFTTDCLLNPMKGI